MNVSDAKTSGDPYIVFELAGTTYAVPSRTVQQMEMVEHITPVPNAPGFVEGVVFSRGKVVPALNLRQRFGLQRAPIDLRTRLIVIGTNGRTVGLLVDTAREFLTIPAEAIKPPPEAVTGLSGKYLQSIATLGDRLILILNVDEILNFHDVIAASEEALPRS
jgi:purine-binding chemotaxis protein CheW